MILSCRDIHKSFGSETVLQRVSFLLEEKEKAAVVGVNGAGKTTLFKILAGGLSADGGSVALAKTAALGYLAQIPDTGEATVYDEMLKGFERALALEQSLREMERRMAGAADAELQQLMAQYERATHEFEQLKGYEYKSRIRGVLRGLGFTEDEFDRPISTLSGGQRTRVALAGLLLREPEVLLLDEPTNHLDLQSVEWLEEFLSAYPGALLIISHDRYFLDRVVTKVIEIEHGCSVVYTGNYSQYAKKKEADRENSLKRYLDQQKEIKRQEAVIAKLKSYNREKSIKRAESREKLLDKMERLEKPQGTDKMRMALLPSRRSGIDVLAVENLAKSYDRRVFEHVSFAVRRTEKVALIGPNGVGKTTLLKILMSELAADAGSFRLGQNVTIGYYDQEHENLDVTKTVLAELSDSYPRLTVLEIRNALAAFMFTGDDVYKPISALSGGERGRVTLVKLMLGSANLLLLDEPTNHLDMDSREILEDALLAYGGTVLYISHDRYFISRTAEKIIELTETGALTYEGGYDYYLAKKSAAQAPADGQAQPSANEYRQKKEKDSAERRANSRLARLENEIAELEAEKARLDGLLHGEAGVDFVRANELYEEKLGIETRLEALYTEWSEIC